MKWMVGDKEIILAQGCRQIKNIYAAIQQSSDEERDDSGNMLDDVSSVEDGDIENNSGCNVEDSSLLAPQSAMAIFHIFG